MVVLAGVGVVAGVVAADVAVGEWPFACFIGACFLLLRVLMGGIYVRCGAK